MSLRTRDTRATRLAMTASHYLTFFLGKRLDAYFPLVFVVGFPKSGTTWACQLVADYLQLPFPRFSVLPVGCAAVVHGHELIDPRMKRVAWSLRDGRDAYVSFYFHLLRDFKSGPIGAYARTFFPYPDKADDVRLNLPGFIERQIKRKRRTSYDWSRHVQAWMEQKDRPGLAVMKYESLLANGVGTLMTAVSALTGEPADEGRARATIEKFSFQNQAGRKKGQEDRSSFLRRGEAGDWRNHFSAEAAAVFDRYCGQELVDAGYEPDRSWVGSVS